MEGIQERSFFRGSLRNKLLAVLLFITLIPLGILNFISYQGMKSQMQEDQGRRLSGYSRRIARTIDMSINERIGDIAAWTALETVRTAIDIGGGQAGANELFDQFVKSYGTFDLIMLMDQRGDCIASSSPEAVGMGVGDYGWFKSGMEGKEFIGEFDHHALLEQFVPASKGWSLLITMPVTIQNEVKGVLAGYIKWELINHIIEAFPVQTSGYTYLVDRRDMRIIAHPSRDLIGLKLTDPSIDLPQVADVYAKQARGSVTYQFLNPATQKSALRTVGFMANEGYEKFAKKWVVASGANYDEIFAALPKQRLKNFIISALFVSFMILGAIFLSRTISRPILETSEAMVAITRDLDFTRTIKVEGQDEIAMMEIAFNRLITKLRETFGTIVQGNEQVSGAVSQVQEISAKIVNNATEQAKRAQDVLRRIEVMGQTAGEVQKNAQESQKSYGDTSTSITELTASIEEIARVAQSQATMVEEIRGIINLMGETAQQVATRASQQKQAAEQTAKEAEQMALSIRNVSGRASEADKQSTVSYQAAVEGKKAVEQVAHGMQNIAESSEQITEIIEVISDIADQTNLLALNAAIEAARAGEHGRGFAVVAEEVRKLAERTAESTKEISALIKSSAEHVKEGADLATSSQKALENIVATVEQTSALVREIDTATNEQTKGIQQVSEAMDRLLKLSAEISELTGEQVKRRERAGSVMNEVYELSRSVSLSTQDQVKTADQVLKEVMTANKFAENITDMTSQQKERSQMLQQIIQDMSNVALTNASGARNSQQQSEKLAELMQDFSRLIAQFHIGHSFSDGNGRHGKDQLQKPPEDSGKEAEEARRAIA